MKYFYLCIQILFTASLISCSTIESVKEKEIIIINDKEKALIDVNIEENKDDNHKVIKSISKEKKNESVGIENTITLKKSDIIEKEEKSSLVFKKTIKVGLLLPLSGEYAGLGKAIYNAVEMALFETESKNIQLIFSDSGDTVDKALLAAQQLEREGASILIGPIFSSQALAIRNKINIKIPIFSFTNDEAIKQNGLWVLGFSPKQQIKAIFNEMLSNSISNIAIIVPNSNYGEIVLQESRKQSEQNNIKINNIYFYDVLSNDFSDLGKLLKVEKNIQYNGLLIIASGKQLKEISARAQYRGIDPKEIKYFGISGWNNLAVLDEPALLGGYFIAPQQSSFEAFVSRYFKIYNSIPLELSGLGYDVLALCSIALKQTESMSDFISFITNSSGFNGIFGFFRADKSGTIYRKFVSYKVMERNFVRQRDIMP